MRSQVLCVGEEQINASCVTLWSSVMVQATTLDESGPVFISIIICFNNLLSIYCFFCLSYFKAYCVRQVQATTEYDFYTILIEPASN